VHFPTNEGYRLDRLVGLRKPFAEYLRTRSIEAVVTLMPHVGSPLVVGTAKRQGIPYAVVVHDARPAAAQWWMA
jgi:hypothetical protein